MGGFVAAWLAGEALIAWRWAKAGAPPTPGTLALASGFYVLLAVVAEYPPARTVATVTAWGVTLAAFLQVLPAQGTVQVTGWPPLMINDPTVLFPGGSGQGAPTGITGSPVKPFG